MVSRASRGPRHGAYCFRFRSVAPTLRAFLEGSSTVLRSCTHQPLASRGRPQSQTQPTTLAGTPATMACGGTSFVTTAPAATMALRPIVIPQRIVAFAPILAPSSTCVGTISQYVESALGYKSFVKQAWGPTNTRFPIVTPL